MGERGLLGGCHAWLTLSRQVYFVGTDARSVCFSCLRTHNANFYCFYQRLFSPFIVMISGIDYHLGKPGRNRASSEPQSCLVVRLDLQLIAHNVAYA